MINLINRYSRNIIIVAKASIAAMVLVACGGDGGGGGPVITYTGVTTQASIDGGNALDFAVTAFEGPSSGLLSGGISKPSQNEVQPFRSVLGKVIHDRMNKTAFIPETETENGNCGGTSTFTFDLNEDTGDFTGEFTFNNYCEDGETTDGSFSVSGTFNQDGSGTMEFSTDKITISSEGESIVMAGEFSATFSSNGDSTITMNLVIQDSSGKIYKTENYTISENSDGTTLSLNGRFFHPDYGYVDVTTSTEFQFDIGNEFPSQGVLVVTGVNNTSVRLTVIDSTQFRLEADLNGDGVYSGPGEDLGAFNWLEV